MEQNTDSIIELIKINRISTTEVADCMGKSGLYPGARSIRPGTYRVGRVRWMYALNESNWSVHEMARSVRPGDVVLIEAINCGERALIGKLVSKFILLYRQAAAIVTSANMRDANSLLKEGFAIWCGGFSPIGCFNTEENALLDEAAVEQKKNAMDGSIAVCDDSGVVLIPKELHTQAFYQKLIDIENLEDTWFDCLDRKKWDTFDIVCKKKYLRETGQP